MGKIYYTGIGARLTPGPLIDSHEASPLSILRRWGYTLALLGFTLRSGAADGADHAFENGCNLAGNLIGSEFEPCRKEIYLPWAGFNGSQSALHYIPSEAFEIAADIYGVGWKHLKLAVKKLMARNILQVMGIGLDEPSTFVLCWTRDGCNTADARTKETGGTGQAIAYADEMNIPIFNFGKYTFDKRNGKDDWLDYFDLHIAHWLKEISLEKIK